MSREKRYYNAVEDFVERFSQNYPMNENAIKQFNSVVRGLSPKGIEHDKLNDFQIKESIMLKGKLMLIKIFGVEGRNTKKLGLAVISGKPFHNGHYNLLEIASKENDTVYAVTSDTSRSDFSGEWSIKAFEMVYLPLIKSKLPNVNIAFSQDKNPQTAIDRFLNDYSRNPDSMKWRYIPEKLYLMNQRSKQWYTIL